MLDQKLEIAFNKALNDIKTDSTELYTQLKNFERTNSLKAYFFREIKEYINKRAKRGKFDNNQHLINKAMKDCFDLLIVSMQKHFEKRNMSDIAKSMKEQADTYQKDLEASATTGDLHGEFTELEGVVEVPRIIEDDTNKGADNGYQEDSNQKESTI